MSLLHRYSLTRVEDYYFSLKFDGRQIALFGRSPDVVDKLVSVPDLTRFIARHRITDVMCLDSERVAFYKNLYLHQDISITAKNILRLYVKAGVKVHNEFSHVRLDLADLFEYINAAKIMLIPDDDNALRKHLQQGKTLGNALNRCRNRISYNSAKKVIEYLSRATFVGADYFSYFINKRLKSSIYYPTKIQAEAFQKFLSTKSTNIHTNILVHCASGAGRTAFYLTAFLMLTAHAGFAEVVLFLADCGYPTEEIDNYKDVIVDFKINQ